MPQGGGLQGIQGLWGGIVGKMDCLRPLLPTSKVPQSNVPSEACPRETQESMHREHQHQRMAAFTGLCPWITAVLGNKLFPISYLSRILVINPAEGQDSLGMGWRLRDSRKVILALTKLFLPLAKRLELVLWKWERMGNKGSFGDQVKITTFLYANFLSKIPTRTFSRECIYTIFGKVTVWWHPSHYLFLSLEKLTSSWPQIHHVFWRGNIRCSGASLRKGNKTTKSEEFPQC